MTVTRVVCERCGGEGQLARYRHPPDAPRDFERIICHACASELIERAMDEEARKALEVTTA